MTNYEQNQQNISSHPGFKKPGIPALVPKNLTARALYYAIACIIKYTKSTILPIIAVQKTPHVYLPEASLLALAVYLRIKPSTKKMTTAKMLFDIQWWPVIALSASLKGAASSPIIVNTVITTIEAIAEIENAFIFFILYSTS